MKVYIGFSKPNSFNPFASLIEFVEARPYDHAYIKVQEPANRTWMIFQASGLVVNLITEVRFLNNHVSLKEYEIDINASQYMDLWNYINSSLGIPYSLIEDFGILLMKSFKLKNQPFNQGISAEFCSKLGASVCNLLGIAMPEDVSDIDPTTLDSILASKGFPYVET